MPRQPRPPDKKRKQVSLYLTDAEYTFLKRAADYNAVSFNQLVLTVLRVNQHMRNDDLYFSYYSDEVPTIVKRIAYQAEQTQPEQEDYINDFQNIKDNLDDVEY